MHERSSLVALRLKVVTGRAYTHGSRVDANVEIGEGGCGCGTSVVANADAGVFDDEVRACGGASLCGYHLA
jgi:hypothetical protein